MNRVLEFVNGRCGDCAWDWKERLGSAMYTPSISPSPYDEAEESLICNFQPIFGDPGRDALMLGHTPEALTDNSSGYIGGMSTAEDSLATLQPLNKKARCSTQGHISTLQIQNPSVASSSSWRMKKEANYEPYYPYQTSTLPRESQQPPPPPHLHPQHQQQQQLYPPLPVTLPYGEPPQSFLSAITTLDHPFSEKTELTSSLHHHHHQQQQQQHGLASYSVAYHHPQHQHQSSFQDIYDRAFSSPSESETFTNDGIPKMETINDILLTKPLCRRPSRSSSSSRRTANRSKGVTMCLRTLLRQLLAGTGWIMDSSISKDQATRLIKRLIGQELDSKLKIELSPEHNERMTSEWKELHFARILPELMSLYVGKTVTLEESQEYIKRDKGPYHLTPEFVELLQNKPWPPVMEDDIDLREFGCYRQGEATKRARTSSNDSLDHHIS